MTFITVFVCDRFWHKVDLFRQTYFNSGIDGNCKYISEDPAHTADFVLMSMNEQYLSDSLHYPRDRRILFIMENPEIWRVPDSVISSAGIIISPFEVYTSSASKSIIQHPCVPWFYGINFDTTQSLLHIPLRSQSSLDVLTSMTPPQKSKLISIIQSTKQSLPGYKWRTQLAIEVKAYFGRDCDLYGFGHNPISDKANAIDPYAFHICIENSPSSCYWTEKLVDPLLGFSYPIYCGASSVSIDYPSPILTIPYYCDVSYAIEVISRAASLYSNDNIISLAKNRIHALHYHNLFSTVSRIVSSHY